MLFGKLQSREKESQREKEENKSNYLSGEANTS